MSLQALLRQLQGEKAKLRQARWQLGETQQDLDPMVASSDESTAFASVESHGPREAKAPAPRPVSRLPRQLLGLAVLLAALALGLRVSKSDAGDQDQSS